MASGNMTVTTAEKHIGEVWPSAVLRAQHFNMVIAPRVSREYKFVGHGDVYHIPRIPNLESADKSGGSEWTPTTYTDTEQTITINKHKVAGFRIEDITKLLANTNLEMEMRKNIGYSLARAVDVDLATLPQSFSQIVGAFTDELDYNDFVTAWLYLAEAGISLDDNCSWVISPAAMAGLLKLDIFINQLYQGANPKAVQQAKIGNILGAPVFVSNLTRAPSANQSESWLAFKKAMAIIMAQEVKMVTEYQATHLGMVVGGHTVYGFAEINRYSETPGNLTATDEWAVLLRTVG